jgi:hypothetical protein
MMEDDNIQKDILPKSGAGQEGTDEVVDTYLKDTPGQEKGILSFRNYLKQQEEK